jgi:hypothetical protein
MSREELVSAYLNGEISRRTFVRRLVAAGVSLTAALSYAEIDPALAHAGAGHKHYNHYKHYNH